MASPLSSEGEVKLHPYQKAGAKGAFELKQVYQTRKGVTVSALFVRVDMPGVPDDGVKIVKYSDSRTVTFNGRAPMVWPQFDSSERVYAGYVVLDKDPAKIEEQCFVKNGCLRLFFPNCDGTLHFLSVPNSNPTPPLPLPQDDDDDTVEYVDQTFGHCCITFIEHAPEEACGVKLRGGRTDHINPYLLSGVKGVYEHKVVNVAGKNNENENMVYVRVDVPMVNSQMYCITENPIDRRIRFVLDAPRKDSFFDEGDRPRGYMGSLIPNCECCAYEVVQHDLRDGVIRFLAKKAPYVEGDLKTLPSGIHFYKRLLDPGKLLNPVDGAISE